MDAAAEWIGLALVAAVCGGPLWLACVWCERRA